MVVSTSSTTAYATEINFQILAIRWLSLSKPPSLLVFSYGRFDASTNSATTGLTPNVSAHNVHHSDFDLLPMQCKVLIYFNAMD